MDFATLTQTAPEYVTTTMAVHGDEGRRWLTRLADLIALSERRWNLRVGPPFPNLSYNYVAPADREDGTPTVLKLCVPNHELSAELDALRHFNGRGCARLLASDEVSGALLLERVEPGTPLAILDDDEAATSIAEDVMGRLWQTPPDEHRFPTVEDWERGFGRLRDRSDGPGPLPAAMVERAESLVAELLASSAPAVVLHGDLHHGNLLAATRDRWLAIDPKGVLGEPAYEVGALLRNPMEDIANWPNFARIMNRRVDQLLEALGVERERVRGWSIAQAVLAAWWCIADNACEWEPQVRIAEALVGTPR